MSAISSLQAWKPNSLKPSDVLPNLMGVLRGRWHFRGATHIGAKVRSTGKPLIRNYGTLNIGAGCRFISFITPIDLMVGDEGTMTIGDGSFINYGVSITAMERVEIGRNCNIGTYVMIIDNNFHRLEPERRLETPPSKPIVLGDNVWLGGRVMVMPGVTIGAGSVVGAGSIVTKDIPPRSLAVGSPARVIKQL